MAKKYVIRSFNPGKKDHKKVNTLINLSALGINTSSNLIKTSLSLGVSQTSNYGIEGSRNPNNYEEQFQRYLDISKTQSQSYAFFELEYINRREYLRQFAQSNEINFVLDTITNDAIVNDDNGFFAQLDLDRLKLNINKNYNNKKTQSDADKLIHDCKQAYNIAYTSFNWDITNNGWNYFKKFLIDGYLAFEILYNDLLHPTTIVGYMELDPATLEPDIKVVDGIEYKVWYQFRGDATRERIIPDANIIYISWTSINFAKSSRVSYLEGLTRSYNMLKQIENAHLIWNIQNSQKRIKITVPVGTMTEARARQRVSEVVADYNEEVSMDDASGSVIVNGQPKYSFSKTYVFAQRDGNNPQIEEISSEGYDMNSTDSLQYFWRKFILETQVPANRFTMNISSPPSNALMGDSIITREEYAYSRFIRRIQSIYKEILLKPTWTQICLMHPELSRIEYLRQCLGINFNEENIFALAKKRQAAVDGTNSVSQLYGLQGADGKPLFAMEFLVKEYLGMSDVDWELNRKYKEAEIIKQVELAKKIKEKTGATDAANAAVEGNGGGGDFGGGGMDFGGGDFGGGSAGGGMDFGGGSDAGADMGGSEEPGGDFGE